LSLFFSGVSTRSISSARGVGWVRESQREGGDMSPYSQAVRRSTGCTRTRTNHRRHTISVVLVHSKYADRNLTHRLTVTLTLRKSRL
jgi:hypothetical protein